MISVYVVEDDPQHRQRYRDAVDSAPDLDWAGSATTVREAVQAIPLANPDVVLVDLGLPDASGLDVVRSVRRTCPQAEIMVVSVFGDERSLMAAIRAGATGYLLKDTYTVDFVSAIRDVRAGQSPISPTLARYLLAAWRPAERPPAVEGPQEGLTDRETEILNAVSRGLNQAEIGKRLFISPHTVATHIKNIYRKLEAHSKVEAMNIARERGLLG
jgi:DNA-binding NarL/FixJ family response regulator